MKLAISHKEAFSPGFLADPMAHYAACRNAVRSCRPRPVIKRPPCRNHDRAMAAWNDWHDAAAAARNERLARVAAIAEREAAIAEREARGRIYRLLRFEHIVAVINSDGLPLAALWGDSRYTPIVSLRQEIWFYAHMHTGMSLLELGRRSQRHHTTVMSGIERHRQHLTAGRAAERIFQFGGAR